MQNSLVCAELTRLGYYVTHVDAPGFDLILTVENASLRVQVKSTMQTRDGFCIWKCVHRCAIGPGQRLDLQKPITKAQADVLALYHHELRSTVFLPVEGRRIIRLPVSQVRNHDAAISLRAVLDRLYPVEPSEPTASDDDELA